MNAIIRAAIDTDIPRITEIYNWAVENTTASFDINPQTLEQRREWFSQYTDRYPVSVCEVDGIVAGYASLSRFRAKEGFRDTCELSLYIDPKYFGQGIGNLLLNHIIEKAKENKFHAIISVITSDNEISIKMHEKLGFTFCGRLNETGFKFGRYLDCLFYQLNI